MIQKLAAEHVKVSVLVPFRSVDQHRLRLWRFTHARILQLLTHEWYMPEVVVWGDHGSGIQFNHGQAINECAARANGDLFLIMDGDTTHEDGDGLLEALKRSEKDRCWRLPQLYVQTRQEATERFLDGNPVVVGDSDWDWQGYHSWSGLIIVPREAFEHVGGHEDRYDGHGADDVAFGLSLDTLYGKHERYPGKAVHLWHHRGREENAAYRPDLTKQYIAAADNQEAMRRLVQQKLKERQ